MFSDRGKRLMIFMRVERLEALSKDLLEQELDTQEPKTLQTPLMAATLAGAEKSVQFLLSKGADTNIAEKDGYTPFHGAGFQGHAAVAKHLLAHRLGPSDRHKDGATPLHRACWGMERKHTDMVRFLLKKASVDPDEKDKRGITCMEMTNNDNTVQYIKNFKAKRKEKAEKAEKASSRKGEL